MRAGCEGQSCGAVPRHPARAPETRDSLSLSGVQVVSRAGKQPP
ncbi:hypothetical protein Z949_889 [Sulfitobacter guttiformis KCTC 32187]|nr:hypothetical protein Z949_889 [Sulfitobacter guttiformis KCTC 32187]